MYPWNLLCEEAKIKQHTSQRNKNFVKSVRKQHENPDSDAFFYQKKKKLNNIRKQNTFEKRINHEKFSKWNFAKNN